jgi:ribosomal protein S8E
MEKNIETKDKKKQEGDEKTKKRKEKNPRLGRVLASGPVLFPPPPQSRAAH